MKDPTDILWRMTQAMVEIIPPKTLDPSGWELRKELKIFANPQIRCPNCETWIDTKRIWLVDDIKSHLLGCWKLDGSKVNPDREIIHSHVYTNKVVCTGDFSLASDSLFLGVNQGKHYYSTERWISQLGHECPKVTTIICDECNKDEIYPSGPKWERHLCYYCQDTDECDCDMCQRANGQEQCRECEEWMDRDNLDDDLLCENCESLVYWCLHCGEVEVEEAGDLCGGCVCEEDNCGKGKWQSNDYCLDHLYQCICFCECSTRIRREGNVCGRCLDCAYEGDKGDLPF